MGEGTAERVHNGAEMYEWDKIPEGQARNGACFIQPDKKGQEYGCSPA